MSATKRYTSTALQQGTDPADLFGFKMNYNTVDGNTAVANKLYNGNIAETFWSTATDGGFVRNYGYKYDNLNRLKDATYQKSNLVTRMYDENLTYDKNGNIMTLKRNGDNDAQVGALAIDNLAYTYKTNSNGLLNVADGTNSTSGFNDFNKVGDDYVYDANGNLITDKNKKITAVTYNHLNLPTKIVFGTTGSISYVYSGSGQKVEKMVTQGTTITTTNYLNGYLYKNALLQYFPTAEGYVEPNGSSFKYVFQYKDHLGNVRLSYTKNSTTNALDVIEENNYYPFGLRHAGYNTTIVGGVTEAQKVKFGSKEFQNELNLNVYDFGARVYNPEGGPAFWQIDPISHFSQSPYSAFNGNPIYWADPSGMEGEHYNWSTGQYQDKSGKNISFEDAMAGNGMNANGSKKSSESNSSSDTGTSINDDIHPKDKKAYEKNYPRTMKVLNQLHDYVKSHPSILSTLAEYSGYSSMEVLKQLEYDKGDMILSIADLSSYYLSPEGITLSSKDIRDDIGNIKALETAKTNEQIQAMSFYVAVITLHEFVHAGRKANHMDRNNEKSEMGWGWELRVFGKSINYGNAKTSYKEFDWNFKK
jgi:RHS repeat-associated protein